MVARGQGGEEGKIVEPDGGGQELWLREEESCVRNLAKMPCQVVTRSMECAFEA